MILFHLVDHEILQSSRAVDIYGTKLVEILEEELRLLLAFAPSEEFIVLSPSFLCESSIARVLVNRCLPLVDAQFVRIYMREDNIFDLRIKKIDKDSYGRVFERNPDIMEAYDLLNVRKIADMHIPLERKIIHVGRSSFDEFVPRLRLNAEREKWDVTELLKRLSDSERESFLWLSVQEQLDELSVPIRAVRGLEVRSLMNAAYLDTFRAEKIKIPINSRVIPNPMFSAGDFDRETIDVHKLRQLANGLRIFDGIMSMSCDSFTNLKVRNTDYEITVSKIMAIMRVAPSFSEALQIIRMSKLDGQLRNIVKSGRIIFKEELKVEQKKEKVFIVHGHDEAAKQITARFLEKANLKPIILHEQANSGRTIIEKIEAYSDVSFAVVLYTECDLGRDKNTGHDQERFRARQNVVFEHGYLIGKLGRKKVCALVKGDVEKPGDISGVVYTPMDDGGAWKTDLVKELREAGISVSAECLL